ncbi:hypothetical protein H4R35_000569 [Dimargaris xerosporica]|nr:hypothetical protein H4R35_000569 [Dimargaris xerosporica]
MFADSSPVKDAIAVPRRLFHTAPIPFAPHAGPGPFDTWLQQTLNYMHLAIVRAAVTHQHNDTRHPLQDRGEAHVTLITPPEFSQILAPAGVTHADLVRIAQQHRVQRIAFRPICIGRQQIPDPLEPGVNQVVYNLIVASPEWLQLRWAVWDHFVALGGEPSHWDPQYYYPHITIGFTHRDLFDQDGVHKGSNSCWRPITLSD